MYAENKNAAGGEGCGVTAGISLGDGLDSIKMTWLESVDDLLICNCIADHSIIHYEF